MAYRSLLGTGLTEEDIKKMYREMKSVRKVGKKVGISYVTVSKIVKDEILPVGSLPLPYEWSGREHYFKKWHDEHLGLLPRSPKKVAAMYNKPGVTWNAIECYMRRRAVLLRNYLYSLGDLRTLKDKYMIDMKGREIPLESIYSYEIKVDKYTLVVEIHAVLSFHGNTTIRSSVSEILDLFQKESVNG
jgi:hypothetical protein